MPINFPNSPNINDTHVGAGKTWRWNGTSWVGSNDLITINAVDSPTISLKFNSLSRILSADSFNDLFIKGPSSSVTYTLSLSDNNRTLGIVAGLSARIIVPQNLQNGHQTTILQLSTGQITLSAAPGVTLNNDLSSFRTFGRYSACTVLNANTYGWIAYGNLV
jgi:hypothetical protein